MQPPGTVYLANAAHTDREASELGRLEPTDWSLRFTAGELLLELPLNHLVVEVLPDEGGRLEFSHPEAAGWTVTTANLDLLAHPIFRARPQLRAQVSGHLEEQEGRRRLKVCGIFLVSFFVLGALAVWLSGVVIELAARQVPVEWEEQLGQRALAELPAGRLIQSPALEQQLADWSAPILRQLPPHNYQFRFHLVNDPAPNAFALPGGRIVVHTGLLEFAESPEEVAGVLAHEVAHVMRRHGVRMVVTALGPLQAIETVFGSSGSLTVLLGGSSVLLGLSSSRDHEREADQTGFKYLVAAGIDPRHLGRFLTRLDQAMQGDDGPGGLPKALSTHPPTPERQAWLEKQGAKLELAGPAPVLPPIDREALRRVTAAPPPAGSLSERRRPRP